ncbi:unnamed protein product [Closterium sp. Yama58-4]|nr:unnamed protein product [Closterium sp. Yama58-4]
MAENEWLSGYLDAILERGGAPMDTDKKERLDLSEIKGQGGTAVRYFVNEIKHSSEEELHRTWMKATAMSDEKGARMENFTWRIWYLSRKKKQLEQEASRIKEQQQHDKEEAELDIEEEDGPDDDALPDALPGADVAADVDKAADDLLDSSANVAAAQAAAAKAAAEKESRGRRENQQGERQREVPAGAGSTAEATGRDPLEHGTEKRLYIVMIRWVAEALGKDALEHGSEKSLYIVMIRENMDLGILEAAQKANNALCMCMCSFPALHLRHTASMGEIRGGDCTCPGVHASAGWQASFLFPSVPSLSAPPHLPHLGQVKYVVEIARALASMPQVYRVDLLTRQIVAPGVDWSYREPSEMLSSLRYDPDGLIAGESAGAYIIRLPCGPVDWSYGEPSEMLSSLRYDPDGLIAGESAGAYIIRLPCGPRDQYLRKEALWPYVDEFVDGALTHIMHMSRELADQIGDGQRVWPYMIHGHYADAGDIAALLSGALNVPMVLTGHSLGRNKLEQLLKQGRMTRAEINTQYAIDRRIEAEEFSLDAAELVVTSTRQEVEEQWGLYDGFDVRLERVLRARQLRGVSCHGRFMPRMAVSTHGDTDLRYFLGWL